MRFADIKDQKKSYKNSQVIANGNCSTRSPQAICIPQYYTLQSFLTLTPLSPQQGPRVDNINTCNKQGIPVFDSMQFLKLRISGSFHHDFQVKQKTCYPLKQLHKYLITVALKKISYLYFILIPVIPWAVGPFEVRWI